MYLLKYLFFLVGKIPMTPTGMFQEKHKKNMKYEAEGLLQKVLWRQILIYHSCKNYRRRYGSLTVKTTKLIIWMKISDLTSMCKYQCVKISLIEGER